MFKLKAERRKLVLIFAYLAKKDNVARNYKTILSNTPDDEFFVKVVDQMYVDHVDEEMVKEILREVSEKSLVPNPERVEISNKFGLKIAMTSPKLMAMVSCNKFLSILSTLPTESQSNLLQEGFAFSNKFSGASWAVALREKTKSVQTYLQKTSTALKTVGLAAVFLGLDAWRNIGEWWHGRISGPRCVKNIIDCGIVLFAGAIGMMIPGIGGLLGPVIGEVCYRFSNWMTCEIFNLPKDVAVENAFRFMGLPQDPSNNEINSKYKELCLRYHPVRGGRTEDFQKLQFEYSIVKHSREQPIKF